MLMQLYYRLQHIVILGCLNDVHFMLSSHFSSNILNQFQTLFC